METGKFSDNLRFTKNWLVSGVDRAFKSSSATFQNIGDRLNPLVKSVDFDILFLCPPSGILLTLVNDDIKIGAMKMRQVPCIPGPCANIFQFLVTDDTEITCYYIATWSV